MKRPFRRACRKTALEARSPRSRRNWPCQNSASSKGHGGQKGSQDLFNRSVRFIAFANDPVTVSENLANRFLQRSTPTSFAPSLGWCDGSPRNNALDVPTGLSFWPHPSLDEACPRQNCLADLGHTHAQLPRSFKRTRGSVLAWSSRHMPRKDEAA